MNAEIINSDGTNIEVIRSGDAKRFQIPLNSLNKPTNKMIKAWIKAGGHLSTEFEVEVDTGKTSKTTGAEDFDDKRVNLQPIVEVTNSDTSQFSKPLKITVFFLGRLVTGSKDMYVFRKQEFDLPKLGPVSSSKLKIKPISEPYDDRGYSKFGARYLGYAWVIHEKDNKTIISSGSVPSSLTQDEKASLILAMKEKSAYDKDLTISSQ